MSGKFIEKSGFLDVRSIISDIISELMSNGFQKIYPSVNFDPTLHRNVILKAGPQVNPLSSQDWAIKFLWDNPVDTDAMCDVFVATPLQFNLTTGDHTLFDVGGNKEALGILGSINKNISGSGSDLSVAFDEFYKLEYQRDPFVKTFLYRKDIEKDFVSSHVMSYCMSITNRGLALSIWEEATEELGNKHSWFVVQRPVKREDGSTVVAGKAPVHCIYGLSGEQRNKPWIDKEYDRYFVGLPPQLVPMIVNAGVKAVLKYPTLGELVGNIVGEREAWHRIFSNRGTLLGWDKNLSPEYNDKELGISRNSEIYKHLSKMPTISWQEGINSDGAFKKFPKPKTYCVNRFIVREKDITAPYPTNRIDTQSALIGESFSDYGRQFGIPADEHTIDYSAVMNTKQQVSVSEGASYVITFPNGMNTARFAYTHEMDMIAYTSADVISNGSEVNVQVYGEVEQRTYVGLNANGPNNTGMRILFLKSGGGID